MEERGVVPFILKPDTKMEVSGVLEAAGTH